ncbi:MAG: Lnb N-terminal periplasmic domain-containing protein [Desulfobacterales bacterium]
MRRVLKLITILICIPAVILSSGWAALAIYYSDISGESLRTALAIGFSLAVILAFFLMPNRKGTLLGFLVVFAVIVTWWTTIPASNDRHWQREVTVLPFAEVRGDLVTVHNIRNLAYRTETDFDVRYYDKTFDLGQLDAVDLIAVYWMGDAIAHVMISFGFQEKDFLTFSIETRKEFGEDYSTLTGIFKQYELIYIVGDERDLIRVRTDFRNPPEDVYLYRLKMPRENACKFFLEYIRQINSMRNQPEWYNTLTTNCTTNVMRHVRAFAGRAKYNWKVLLSGYTPQYAYQLGALDTTIPFGELRKKSYINPKARVIGDDPEFSRKIREGLPSQILRR